MNPFSQPFNEVTFNDVEDFCKQKHPESTTLDYKKDIPRDLAKHFATFSNTLGGMIIVGVEEAPATGEPLMWEGVINEGKLLERVNQFAANVNPIPTYNVRLTDEKNNKVFLLINILEGDAQPYLANGDPTVWLRTGNISRPLRQADREELVRMVEKKNLAIKVRDHNLKTARSVFDAGLEQAENERISDIAEAKKLGKSHALPTKPYNVDNSFLTVSLQPFYPKRLIIEPREIKSKLVELQTANHRGSSFPPMDLGPMPNGLYGLKQSIMGDQVRCYQICGNGLIYYTEDVWWIEEASKKSIYLWHVADALCKVLVFARKFYSSFGYSGLLVGGLTLENALGALIHIIVPDDYSPPLFGKYRVGKLSNYGWEIAIDTHILSNEDLTAQLFRQIMEKVYWDLGIETFQHDFIDKYLEQSNWK